MTDETELQRLIAATRAARDNAARAAALCSEIGADSLATSLGELAGSYDRLLAHALRASGVDLPPAKPYDFPMT